MKKKMKRTIAALMTAALLLTPQPGFVMAAEAAGDTKAHGDVLAADGWTAEFDEETGTITISGTGACVVDSLPPSYSESVKKLVVQEGITSVHFAGNHNLQIHTFPNVVQVSLPSTLKEIKDYSFANCTKLTDLVLPPSLERIGKNVFYECTQLTEIDIPQSVTEIGDYAFCYCKTLQKVDLHEGLKTIGSNAFFHCEELKEIAIPQTVERIGNNTFEGCSLLPEIEIPSKVQQIGTAAFFGCKKLKKVVFNEGLETIGTAAFANSGITEIDVPQSVKQILDGAFFGCEKLAKVTLHEGLEVIGNMKASENAAVFANCPTLKDVAIPSTVKVIGNKAFDNSGLSLITLPDKLEQLGDQAIKDNLQANHVSNIALPASLTYIGEDNFPQDCLVLCTNDYQVGYCEENKLPYAYAKEGIEIETCDISIEGQEYEYTGEAIQPKTASIVYSGEHGSCTLTEGKDYQISYKNNTACGTASVIIKGLGAWKGEKEIPFEIYRLIEKCAIDLDYLNVLYNGQKQNPKVMIKYGEETLVEGKDYTLSYANDIEEGTATVTITGKGVYRGSVEKEYTIYKKSVENCQVSLEYTSVLYDGSPKKPAVTVKDSEGNTLTEGTDYEITYANDTDEGTATVSVTGKGSYKGSVMEAYTIYKKSVEDCAVSLAYTSVLYDGSSKKPAVTVKDSDGNTLTEGTDYEIAYANDTEPGTATVTITGKELYKGVKNVSYTIEKIPLEQATVTLSETIFTYDGSEKKPTATVVLNGKTLTPGVDFAVTYEANINEGTACAVIQGTGHYTGTARVNFTILPYSSGKDSVYSKDDTLISENLLYHITDAEEGEVEIASTSSKGLKSLVIPATVTYDGKTYKVTSIGKNAFYKNTKLTSIVIGNNVTSIEDYAFYGCKNVTSIKMGRSVEIIGASSFRKCTKLTSITLPKSIDELGKNAFYGCKKLRTITIQANSVVDVADNAIKGISKKAVIKVPKKLVKGYKKELGKKTGYKKTMKIKKK